MSRFFIEMRKLEAKEKFKEPEIDLTDFEARQNAIGFLSVALKVVLRNPELRKKIFNENNANSLNKKIKEAMKNV